MISPIYITCETATLVIILYYIIYSIKKFHTQPCTNSYYYYYCYYFCNTKPVGLVLVQTRFSERI